MHTLKTRTQVPKIEVDKSNDGQKWIENVRINRIFLCNCNINKY